MSDLKLNEDGDLYFEKGQLVLFTKENEATKQRLQIKLQTYLAEWFLDKSIGVPYFQVINKKGTPKALVDSIFRNLILSDKGVTSLNSFKSEIKADTYNLSFSATTIDDEIISIQQQIVL